MQRLLHPIEPTSQDAARTFQTRHLARSAVPTNANSPFGCAREPVADVEDNNVRSLDQPPYTTLFLWNK